MIFRRVILGLLVFTAIMVMIAAGSYFYADRNLQNLSDQAEKENRYQDQIGYLTDLAGREPWRKNISTQIANAYFESGDYVNATVWFEKTGFRTELSFEDEFHYGYSLMELGNVDTARKVFSKLGATPGRTEDEYFQLVLSQRKIGDLDGALSTIKIWEKESGSASENLNYQLGLIRVFSDPDSAASTLLLATAKNAELRTRLEPLIQTLISTDIKVGDRWYLIGQALFDLREWDLSEKAFSKSSESNPKNAEGWAMLGQTRELQEKDGYSDLVKALNLNPGSRLGRYFLAVYWRDRGQWEIAKKYLTDLSLEEPGESLWQLEIGKTSYAAGDLTAALEHFQSAVKLDPENVTYWQTIAEFSLGNGIDIDGVGEGAVQKSVLLTPKNPISNDLMGWLFLIRGDYDNSAKFLRQSVASDPEFARARLHYGQALQGLGDLDSARMELIKAVSLDPTGTVGLTANRLLERYFQNE
jgi:tetratricopeptide (TPR) repeat protein